ncbi:cilia- and flagella-associated protein 68 isoform X1 [Saimiri boliviensis]|uniref:Cilia and flagella associated protein 68 n=1 Tax=Saimiri boliviensis boliviensis TaxID=39432 RepID=A0A2K6U1V4_SAIBB|nr:UPF0686 protein C11orf1 homolog isoform X1 [Saimiri boliviensis boliviensis]
MEQPNKDFCHSPKKSSNSSTYSTSSYSSSGKRQNLVCFLTNPHCGSLINADGHGEVWTDWNSTSKFFQYGWRCTTNENTYSNRTLMGNWNQERYDLRNVVQPKPLPSQFGHYFETTYDTSYNNKMPLSTHRFKREPHWFPGHQPELDPPQYKCTEKSTYMNSYSKPQIGHHSGCV